MLIRGYLCVGKTFASIRPLTRTLRVSSSESSVVRRLRRAVSVNHQRVLGLGRFEAIDRTLTDRFGNLGTIYGNSNRNGTM
ncbi:hypothetical protein Hrd1104_11385 [Halorhabdus sp. CBA1104]|nr:hypothetical protein Hrd1104_11385 [Halorhabdus sp. CBA1104]